MRNAFGVLIGKPENNQYDNLDAELRTILKYIYAMDVKVWSAFNWLRIRTSNVKRSNYFQKRRQLSLQAKQLVTPLITTGKAKDFKNLPEKNQVRACAVPFQNLSPL